MSAVTKRPAAESCVRCKFRGANYVDNLICADCLQYYYGQGIFHIGAIKKVIELEYQI